MPTFLNDIELVGGSTVKNLPAPVLDTDAAPKGYVDSAIEGIAWKDSARVGSVANVNLTSPGASIDGIALAADDRVLLKDQTDAKTNGIYIWNGAAVAMTRSADAATSDDLEQATITVEEGTSAGVTFRQTTVNFVLETGNIAFTAFGTSAPDASTAQKGLIEIATQGEVDAGASAVLAVTPQTLKSYSGMVRKATGLIGDGSATQIDFAHNLAVDDLCGIVLKYEASNIVVDADYTELNTNTLRLNFATAPTASQLRITVSG